MSSVNFFNYDTEIQCDCVLFKREDEYNEYRHELNVKRKYLLSPNHDLYSDEIFKFYQEYKYDKIEDNRNIDLNNFFSLWNNFIFHFNQFDLKICFEILKSLKTCSELMNDDDISALLEYLTSLISYLKKVIFEEGPIYGLIHSEKDKFWFNFQLKRTQRLDHVKLINANYKSFVNCARRLNLGELLSNIQIDKKHITMSAFCFSIAKFYCRKDSFNLTLQYLHRSVDLFLSSLLWQEHLIERRGNQVLFKSTCHEEGEVFLLKAYKELTVQGIFTDTPKRNEYIQKLNSSRNKSVLTHQAYGISKKETIDLLHDWKKLFNGITEFSAWEGFCEKFELKEKIKPFSLFESNQEFWESFFIGEDKL